MFGGVVLDAIKAMIASNPYDLLDLDNADAGPSDADRTWAAALNHDPCHPPVAHGDGHTPGLEVGR